MKQLFRIAVIILSLFILAACGGQNETQVKQISEIATSTTLPVKKDLISVSSSDKEQENTDETETNKEDKTNKTEETNVADSSQGNQDKTSSNTSNENRTTSESSSDSYQQEESSNKSISNSNNQSTKSDNPSTKNKASSKTENSKDTPEESSESKNVSKPKPKEKEKSPPPAPKKVAYVSIESPSDLNGPNLSSTEVEITEGETAFAATLRVLKSKGISIDYTGSGATAYVKSIGGLGEFDAGPLSGWNVLVEDIMIPRSADAYEIFDGYRIHWRYTKNYLEDSPF